MSRQVGNSFGGSGSFDYIHNVARGGKFLADFRDARPVPPIADYVAYGETLDPRAQKHFNPHKHRRITILVRNGETFKEACALAGFRSVGAVRKTRDKMPEHLR